MSIKDQRQYAIEVEWSEGALPDLPNLVGPFDGEQEAVEWGERNIPNGVWNVAPLAYPYARTGTAAGSRRAAVLRRAR